MTDLFEALDAAASELLEKAKASDNLDKAVSVFQTVARYAEQRAKMAPPEPVKTERPKIDELRERFNGSAPKGRTPRRSAALSVVEPASDTAGEA